MASNDKNENYFRQGLYLTCLHYRNKQSGSGPLSKLLLIALIEIGTFSSVHDIFCFANILNPDQAHQNKGPD